MATLSSPGLGSGLNVSDIVTKLVAIERQPIEKLATQATAIQADLSSFGLLSSYVGNIRDISDKIAQPSFWTGNTASTTDTSISVSAAPSATAGNYSVEVSQLASAQSLASKPFLASGNLVGSGKLTIQLGSWNSDNTVFTANPIKASMDITVTASDTMDTLKTKINSAGAGVTASIVTDASGSRLVMRSTTTGVENAVRITAADDDGNNTDNTGLSAFAFDPQNTPSQMTQTQQAKNTLAKINGLDVSSATNKFENTIDGVTLTVNKITTAAATVTVGPDTASIKSAITSFAKAFSDLNSYIATQTKYDATTKKAAALQGDRATLTVQSNIRGLVVGTSSASTTFSRLSDVGLEIQKDGTLKVNDTKLSAALAANPAEVAKLFSGTSTADAGAQGFAVRAKAVAASLISSSGAITTHTKGLRDAIARNANDQTKLEARVSLTEARLNKQYTALDTLMSSISGTNSSLTQSLTALSNLSTSIAKG